MYKHILVAVDKSEPSGRAVSQAMEIARATGARVTLLHAIPSSAAFQITATPFGPITPLDPMAIQRYENEVRDSAVKTLEELRERFTGAGIVCDTSVQEGHAGEAICDEAERLNADLIVMGRRGLGAVTSFFVGGVSDKVVHHTHRSVLLVQ